MNRTILVSPIAAALMLTASHAATLSWSTTAPTVDGADISNFIGAAADVDNVNNGGDDGTYIANNRPWIAQTFTTGTNSGGYELSAITLRHVTYENTWWSVDAGWVGFGNFTDIGIGTISGTTFTRVGTAETADMTVSGNAALDQAGTINGTGTGMYFTMTLANPITLSPNTTYAFTASSNNPFLEIDGNDTTSDNYTGGEAFFIDRGDGVTTTSVTGDHVFHLDLAAVPEPSAALLGGLGLLALLRRRRS